MKSENAEAIAVMRNSNLPLGIDDTDSLIPNDSVVVYAERTALQQLSCRMIISILNLNQREFLAHLNICLTVSKLFFFDFFFRTRGPILTKPGTQHLWMNDIKICLNKGPCSLSRGIINVNLLVFFQKSSSQNQLIRQDVLWQFKFRQCRCKFVQIIVPGAMVGSQWGK